MPQPNITMELVLHGTETTQASTREAVAINEPATRALKPRSLIIRSADVPELSIVIG
jgi:deoxycytidine triphosphate deaminase